MRIRAIRAIHGPNVHSHHPVLIAELDLEHLTGRESREFPSFNEKLTELIPGLGDHYCGLGYCGGFLERLRDGTYFGHIVEHASLELSVMAGIPSRHGKTRQAGAPSLYNVIVEYASEDGMKRLLEMAVDLVRAILAGKTYPLSAELDKARKLIQRTAFGPSTRAIVEAAEQRSIPWRRLSGGSLVQLGYGCNRKIIAAALTSNTNCIAVDIACDKELTKQLLRAANIPVAAGALTRTADEAINAMRELRPPYVIKPADGCQGRGVSLHLRTAGQVRDAYECAREFSESVLIEEQLEGSDYRVLVINGHVAAASLRTPAHVSGDGQHTVAELIDIKNSDPRRGAGHENVLSRITIDSLVEALLTQQGLTLTSIPEAGRCVPLRGSANLSTGGEATDVSDRIHPDLRSLCERAARTIGLDVCGVDLIAETIDQPLNANGGIVELNASPGLRMHLAPSQGSPRDAAGAVVESLYPRGHASRIPIISITGTNGKTTVTRMIAHVIQESGRTVGMTTTDGIWIGGECAAKGDMTGPASAWTVLSDPAVEVAVLETARGGIVRKGLGYDWSDAAVITNIQPDHMGQDGIETLEDILEIKSLAAERVRAGGTVILNADDARLAALPSHRRMQSLSRRIVYFAMNGRSGRIQRHLADGGTAYFVEEGRIVEATGLAERFVADLASIPVTMGGLATYQTQNVLAAVAACRAYDLSAESIAASLKTFRSNGNNAGRCNLYRAGRGYVMIDYGHNAPAIEALSRITRNWPGGTVIGVVGVPGDRTDDLIRSAARAAAMTFDSVIIREDSDLRGRKPGEVPQILEHELRAAGAQCAVCADCCDAASLALQQMEPDGLVVVLYEKLEEIESWLARCGAQPVEDCGLLSRPLPEPVLEPALANE